MESLRPSNLSNALKNVRERTPLVHCITNYVTVNDCANALLACGASPIMSDEPADVEDIQRLCGALVLNIGTLNQQTIDGMRLAAQCASEVGHPVVLDPVGAGASRLRTDTAGALLDEYAVGIVRGNMSEIKALAGAAAATRGVDADPDDAVTQGNLEQSVAFARAFAKDAGVVVAITGAIDIVTDGERAVAIANGVPLMGKITGSGCMLTALLGAYAAANEDPFDAAAAAVAAMGAAGQMAQARMEPVDGNGSFRTYLLDALCNLNGPALEVMAKLTAL